MVEARAMYESRVTVIPGLLIDWEAGKVLRITLNNSKKTAETFDNAGELFGIATTAEHFEQIAEARDKERLRMEAES